jgi:VWFA-related protein
MSSGRARLSSVLVFVAIPLCAQTVSRTGSQAGGTADDGRPAIRVDARNVVIDIVVTGKNGKPVEGLHKEDFRVLENGHDQKINFFEDHKGTQPVATAPAQLPPNVFINLPRVAETGPPIVLLFDGLNTALSDQTYVRQEMFRYLENPPPGRRIAIFAMGTTLRYVQGFTDDPALLAEALKNLKSGGGPANSLLLDSKLESTAMAQAIASVGSSGMGQFGKEQKEGKDYARTLMTFEAFQELAHYLDGIPGRKNVVWFSTAFPLVLFSNPGSHSGRSDTLDVPYNLGELVKETDAALAAAQVAVYPVAAEGLAADPVNDIDSLGVGVHSGYDAQQDQSRSLKSDGTERNGNHAAMDEIARDTGGEAFYNRNRLDLALSQITSRGSNYYTVFYTPTEPVTNANYRKIEVKVATGNYKLTYRRGYFPAKPSDNSIASGTAGKQPADPLSRSMGPGLPDSTQITLAVEVQKEPEPAADASLSSSAAHAGDNQKLTGALTRYGVDFVIATSGLHLDTTPDGGRKGKIEVSLVVFDKDGTARNGMVRELNLSMNAARYAIAEEDGINFHFDIDAPSDATSLRAGVYDWSANRTGTLEVRLDRVVSPMRTVSSKKQ